MKFSKYNIVVPYKDNTCIVFNTLNGTLVRMDSQDYNLQNLEQKNYGILVDDDCNEYLLYKYRYLSAIYNSRSIHLTIATTMSCNFNCPYCFEEGHKRDGLLDKDVIRGIQSFLKSKKAKPISITWFGGEPFLNWSAIQMISDYLLDNQIDFTANAITNGSLFSPSIINKIDEYHIKNLQITLDGLKDTHDKKRQFKTGRGSFEIILNNIKQILEYSQSIVSIRVNLDRNNIIEFKPLKDDVHSIFSRYIKNKRLTITPNYIRNRTSFDGCSNCLSPAEFYSFEASINHIRSLPLFKGPCPLRSMSDICIAPDGEIYKCLEHIGDRIHSIGNIKEGCINLYRQADLALTALPFENEECRNCEILPICGGGCSAEARKKVLENQKINLCPAEKEVIKDLIVKAYENKYI